MTEKKVVAEDYPADSWAKSFRAGDEVDPELVDLFPDLKVVGAGTKAAQELRGEAVATTAPKRTTKPKGEAPKQTDTSVDPAPDAENGAANAPR